MEEEEEGKEVKWLRNKKKIKKIKRNNKIKIKYKYKNEKYNKVYTQAIMEEEEESGIEKRKAK